MTFAPVLPASGALGWAFLKRTGAAQQAALARTPEMQRDADYYRARIGKIDTAEQLVGDRRLLRISLQAFGLDADLDNRAFIRKVLQDGTLKPDALAMRLSDPRYRAFSAAFGFGDFPVPSNKLSDFADKVLSQWQDRRFEAAVGDRDGNLRLALNARREMAGLAASSGTDTAKWFKILGNAPLRQVMQGALGLPSSFATLDLDRQVADMRNRATTAFGSAAIDQFNDPAKVEDLIRRFLVRSELTQSAPQNAALDLLTQTRRMMRRI